MNSKIFVIIVILSFFCVIPSANAQLTIGEEANQESVEIKLHLTGEVNVKHIIKSSKIPVTLEFVDDSISNISITNEDEEKIEYAIIGDNKGMVIFPSNQNSIVEYNLKNILILNDNLWNFGISYSESISIIFPDEVDFIFIDNSLIQLGDKKGIACHGCIINLQYYSTISKISQEIEWDEKEFFVEFITDAEIKEFNFEQPSKSISFKINDKNKFVTIIIPLELLWEPYVIFLDDKKIPFSKFSNNENYVSLNIKPETSGEITIIGTTVIPEFPIIAPLAIGFLIILIIPLMKKVNLH